MHPGLDLSKPITRTTPVTMTRSKQTDIARYMAEGKSIYIHFDKKTADMPIKSAKA